MKQTVASSQASADPEVLLSASKSTEPDETRVVTVGEDKDASNLAPFPGHATLVAETRKVVPRYLTQEQRAAAYFHPAPADWCVAMAQWPYHRAMESLGFGRSGRATPTTTTGQYFHCNGVEEVMPKTPPEEVLRIEVEELAELLKINQGLAKLRAALSTRHLRPEDVIPGGLIESEEETIYGVFVNRAGECTIFEILRDGQVVRWDRVEDSRSLASEYPAIDVAVSTATTQKLRSNFGQCEVKFERTMTGAGSAEGAVSLVGWSNQQFLTHAGADFTRVATGRP